MQHTAPLSSPRPSLATFLVVGLSATTIFGCGNDSVGNDVGSTTDTDTDTDTPSDSEVSIDIDTQLAGVTYWQDAAPIFNEHCTACHQPGGIGPFDLTDYKLASLWSKASALAAESKTMPPWLVTDDGSCGEFSHSEALSNDELAVLRAWAEVGAPEGDPVEIEQPTLPHISDGETYKTPKFTPEIQGGPLAEFDEYRCFLVDEGMDAERFITGYDFFPGNKALVHHALAFTVDPTAAAYLPNGTEATNAEVMQALADESAERKGWPCFSEAGRGVDVSGSPVSWAPGQGAVFYPDETGLRVPAGQQIVVQMHYNLSDPQTLGESDQSTLVLQTASTVKKEGDFFFLDPFLATLGNDEPDSLAPGSDSEVYEWSLDFDKLLGGAVPYADIYGVLPHMHELGHKYRLRFNGGGSEEEICLADIQNWDFNWQRMYFYKKPQRFESGMSLDLTCDFDTSSRTEPVYPGWGTQNEMCLAVLFVVFPTE